MILAITSSDCGGIALVQEDSASGSKLTEHTLDVRNAISFQYSSFKRREKHDFCVFALSVSYFCRLLDLYLTNIFPGYMKHSDYFSSVSYHSLYLAFLISICPQKQKLEFTSMFRALRKKFP